MTSKKEGFDNSLIDFGISMKPDRWIKMCWNETYRNVRIGKHFSDAIPAKNCLTDGDSLSPLLFNLPLPYTTKKVQVNLEGLKLIETHQLEVKAYVDNLSGKSIRNMKDIQKSF